MHKIWMATYKEFLLLKRDLGGLIILFLMPLILVVVITIIQESTSRQIFNSKVPVLLIDKDKGDLSASIKDNLQQNKLLKVIAEIDGKAVDEASANELVLQGAYKLAVVIPEGLSKSLKAKVSQNVSRILEEFEGEKTSDEMVIPEKNIQKIRLYFDPTLNLSVKNAIENAIEKMVSQIETQSVYKAFKDELELEQDFNTDQFIAFEEINPRKESVEIKPNSVQHNVPAWTLFAIFFIIVPLSINIVKEKNQGTFVRLKTNPVSYATILGGKVFVYLMVCLIQFVLMLLVGLYIFPYLDLPEFTVNGSYFLLLLVALFSGLSAIGIGILIGTIAETQEQSAPFGATLVVILAAVGGVWIPVFAMPELIRWFAKISPMNWGLESFYDVIIRDNSLIEIAPNLLMLGGFFVLMILISIYYDKKKNSI